MRAPRFNGWAPFLAVTAACTLIAILTSRNNFTEHSPPGFQSRGIGGTFVPQVPVDWGPRDGVRPAPKPLPEPNREPLQPQQERLKEHSIWDLLRPEPTQFQWNSDRTAERS